ncbi:NADH-quinone oxidoreductase subunit NuoN [Nigerium massiliense]|uniref:NADH-quinone oxidoreductase subunit NuoN n=1 Tax=Nigerium massiliense TaxID=1522317 RepID=UPI0005917263|nr:NADH-quinone oxidoreductase subunit NuoN [Nigerium massiliense]
MTSLLPLYQITVPTLEFRQLAPVLLLFGAACVGVLVDALMLGRSRRFRSEVQMGLVLGSIVAALVYTVYNWRVSGGGELVAMGALMLDGPTYLMWSLLLFFGLLAVMLFKEEKLGGGANAFASSAAAIPGSVDEAEADRYRLEQTEIFPLTLFSLTGMMVFVAANDLLTLFVALEVFSLPLYLMCGMARRRRLLSQEAALKYFLLGAFSSAFFLFGVALLYGYAGAFDLRAIDAAVSNPVYGRGLLYAGLAMLGMGLLFKIGIVPFANWIPDVYMGAPTPLTGLMAICTKLAAFGATMRVFFVALGGEAWTWQPIFAVLSLLTMVVGSVMALTQHDVKRMLAYSSIAHAGFILTAITGANQNVPGGQPTAVSSAMFYLAAYGLATVGAFAVVTLVRNAAGEENDMAGWSGLAAKNPWVAGAMALFLLSMAGIPLTGGFMGKWMVFSSAWFGGYWWLVVAGVLTSLVAAFIYLRLIVTMFGQAPARTTFVGDASYWTWIPIIVGALGTVVLGVAPDLVLGPATMLGSFLR